MSGRFRRTRHGPTAKFAAGEAAVLELLFDDLLTTLDDRADSTGTGDTDTDPLATLTGLDGGDATGSVPDDPVLARLLPDAYRDDPERAAEFRRYTEAELRDGKRAAIRQVLEQLRETGTETGGKLVLADEAAAYTWLGALNDLRLAWGTRLGVTEESTDELDRLPPDSPRAHQLSVYLWLGWLQETLVDAVH